MTRLNLIPVMFIPALVMLGCVSTEQRELEALPPTPDTDLMITPEYRSMEGPEDTLDTLETLEKVEKDLKEANKRAAKLAQRLEDLQKKTSKS